MPLNDPRLVCPECGKLVEIEVDRFEDLFEEPPQPGEEVAPTYHSACMPQTKEEWLRRNPPQGPGWTAYSTDK